MVTVTFPDGTKKEVKKGVTAADVIKNEIGEGLLRAAIAVKLNEQTNDLSTPVTEDSNFQVLTFKDKEGKHVFWHSSAHVLAIAVKRLFPKAQLTIGPPIDEGFYYDFYVKQPFTEEDITNIEAEIKKVIAEDIPFEKENISHDKVKDLFKDNKFKLELIDEYKNESLSVYKTGDFVDLCRGPHVLSTGKIKALKITKYSGAYWRGDSEKEQLQRIYGVSYPSKDELKAYLKQLEEALKRDHNKLGRELGLFVTAEKVGQGLPLITPKGAVILKELQRWIEDEEEKRGYQLTKTPVLGKKDVYQLSGHWDHYRDGMFLIKNAGEEMALRPMTDPFQFLIYKSEKRSYRDLPIRYNETSTLFRNEASGELHGLIRIRQFTLSEGHIICRMDQLEEEFVGALDLINYVFKTLRLKNYTYRLSKWDPNNKEKYIDNPKAWEESQMKLKAILDKLKLEYEEADGEAAFYGPKLDVQMKNVYGKEDTIITIQVDFALPERYDMTYVDADGSEKRPIILHRTSIGCYERTLALLIEEYAGKFPLWLSPTQIVLLPIADRHVEYCQKIAEDMRAKNIRVEINEKPLTTAKKVREAQIQHINYILVVGDTEVTNNTVNVRTRDNVVHGEQKVTDFIKQVLDEIQTR